MGTKPLLPRELDQKLVPPAWMKTVFSHPDLPVGAVGRDAYAMCVLECVLEQLHKVLGRQAVFTSPSNRWTPPGNAYWTARSGKRSGRTSCTG
ncbi:hypothetical protein [Streptomyces sp. SN-593]|nr:hypothetical protein [Streptomyces sp. SN-593]